MNSTTDLIEKIREPKTPTKNPPLIVLLHGYGSNENDLFSFADHLPDQYYVISYRAPYTIQPNSYAWYAIHLNELNGKFSDDKQAQNSRELILDNIQRFSKKYGILANEVTLIGFSQGAILSVALGLTYPKSFKKIIALSGYVNDKILKLPQDLTSLPKFFFSHGSEDQVIPIGWAQQSLNFLKKHHIDYTFKSYPVGHGLCPENFNDMINWMEKA